MAHNNEASVEEILESIKKVIARDNREGAIEMRRQREEEAARIDEASADFGAEEVLDLSEMEMAEDASEGSSAQSEADFIDLNDHLEEDDDDDDASTEIDDTPLIGEQVRGAMQENLAALAMLAEPGAKPQIVRSGETSLEGLTRELLRPMLAEWLDQNLPGMVEKMVRAEIARIAGKKG
ncbi:DUF2497 domain-containing protein [Erythrobacter sp. MTPC3]|uniref:DUF2497 domain-containing protein n=1 Tax=Erythrobacter sp. MTPC3 TaxID=3056564 RepID=UPI0036F34843